MGLDMYLDKAKRIGNATPNEIDMVSSYLDYLLRPSKYKDSTMKEWCGIDEKDVNMEVVDSYRNEYHTKYGGWDTEKKYGWLGLWDGVAYWRKANAIHKWFVENVQDGVDDCGRYEVTKEQLQELLKICLMVKENSKLVDGKVANGQIVENGKWTTIYEDGMHIEDPSIAMEFLPTENGFFFGSTSYDQWYLEDINYTIGAINDVLNTTDFDKEIISYCASW